MPDDLPHPLRSDARDNRERILEAARALFATEGLDVPMREVARRAGVGPATLYRRFPTKQILATEAFAEQMHACRAVVDEGLAEPDAWRGFCVVIEKLFALHARSRGFTEAFTATYPHALDFTTEREYALKAVATLAHRAKDAGRLRPDFVVDDLILMLLANRGIHIGPPAARLAASRRFAAFVIRAFATTTDTTPLPPVARVAPAIL
ncbi:TetR/AcrR family transcriptional regulator [Nocardia sp. BSTN01]|uniref:TetR/AcrR family transcriptional regulator n=1 Tax=Nocardia sp. BSTN01 TaxID=2783665 RepID=UPI00188FB7EE|nr:TetR/AcrR family transcriptional regulator [Nocardia sp. BSTN01]MBF4999745.1 TetR/AcrR family transcriptional regulator [Nocardia sp. BSTN01]